MAYNSSLDITNSSVESRHKAMDAFLEDDGYKNMNDKQRACIENEIIVYLDGN